MKMSSETTILHPVFFGSIEVFEWRCNTYVWFQLIMCEFELVWSWLFEPLGVYLRADHETNTTEINVNWPSSSCWWRLLSTFIRFLQAFFGRIFHVRTRLSSLLEEQKHTVSCGLRGQNQHEQFRPPECCLAAEMMWTITDLTWNTH